MNAPVTIRCSQARFTFLLEQEACHRVPDGNALELLSFRGTRRTRPPQRRKAPRGRNHTSAPAPPACGSEKTFETGVLRPSRRAASRCGTAIRRGGACGVLALAALACARPSAPPLPQGPPEIEVHRQAPPSPHERYCAWYGEAEAGTLYFGEAAFWSGYRLAHDDPRADLTTPGPRPIGRFDLTSRRLLAPIETGPRADGSPTRSGVWDVLPLAGRVYFTTYFEEAGFVDLETGAVTHIPDSRFWNELARGPLAQSTHGFSTTTRGLLLVTRYADAAEGGGAVLVIDPDGRVLSTLTLPAPPGAALAPKTPAWDPVLREVWVTTDRLPLPPPDDENVPFAHPTLVLDLEGREVARFGTTGDPMEIQFVRFDHQGMGYLAVSRGKVLELLILRPTADRRNLDAAPRVLLDDDFAPGLDFAQDIQIGPDGSAFVTQWSGKIHQVTPTSGRVRQVQLPRESDALYYSAVPGSADGSVCATRCAGVEVVCASPAAARTR